MQESIAISVQDVSKKFRLFSSPTDRLREALHPFKKKYHREFWALRGINFEVCKGATVGIIGRNGSGKSTLLQVICSVLRQTSGTVTVKGKVSALLELGAGFNPEFTGRTNVLMYGILMGFSAEEMEERLPQVETFADIGEFIDQPVKTYSSGMFVRLAFAAAINVDPDILIVDEALSVGDAKFQHKCFQKFLDFQDAGKTILFVTHDTNAIVKHCDYAILLENGAIIKSGKPDDVVNNYLEILFTGILSSDEASTEGEPTSDISPLPQDTLEKPSEKPDQPLLEKFLEEVPLTDNCIHRNSYNKNEYRFGDKRAKIIDYLLVCGKDCDPVTICSGDLVDIYLKVKFYQSLKFPLFGFAIKTVDGITVYGSNTRFANATVHPAEKDDVVIFKFSVKLGLHPGDYFIDLGVAEKLSGKDQLMDVRYSIFHLAILQRSRFTGFVELDPDFQEINTMKCLQ